MDVFIALGSNSLIVRAPDGATWTEVNHTPGGNTLNGLSEDGAGTLVVPPQNTIGLNLDKLLVSHDDGLTWANKIALPVTAVNNPGGIYAGNTLQRLGQALGLNFEQASTSVWDGSRFTSMIGSTSAGTGSLFSIAGDAWDVTDNGLAPLPGPGPNATDGTGRALDMIWWASESIYVASFGNQSFIGWSTTNNSDSPYPFPTPQFGTWQVAQQLRSVTSVQPGNNTGWFKTKPGAYILLLNTTEEGTGNSLIWKSDITGKVWTSAEVGAGGFFYLQNGKDSSFYDDVLDVWIHCGGDNVQSAIYTAPGSDPLTLTPHLADPTFTLQFNSVRRTGWFLTAVGSHGELYTSLDAETWTPINADCPGTAFKDLYLTFIHSFETYWIAHVEDNNTGDVYLGKSINGIDWTSQYALTGGDVIYNIVGPSPDTLNSYINPCTGQPVFPPTPPPTNEFLDHVLLYYLGRSRGFSEMVSPLVPGGANLITIKEIQTAVGGTGAWPLAGNGDYAVLALTDDAKSYVLFQGTQDGSLTAVAVTQPLPTPTDLPQELQDSKKIFNSIWVEGQDLGNFDVYYATDPQFDAEGIPTSYPWGPKAIINNKVDIGVQAKQIVLRFVHAKASAVGVTPLITYIELDYDLLGESN